MISHTHHFPFSHSNLGHTHLPFSHTHLFLLVVIQPLGDVFVVHSRQQAVRGEREELSVSRGGGSTCTNHLRKCVAQSYGVFVSLLMLGGVKMSVEGGEIRKLYSGSGQEHTCTV